MSAKFPNLRDTFLKKCVSEVRKFCHYHRDFTTTITLNPVIKSIGYHKTEFYFSYFWIYNYYPNVLGNCRGNVFPHKNEVPHKYGEQHFLSKHLPNGLKIIPSAANPSDSS